MKDHVIIGVFIAIVVCLCLAGVLVLGGLGYWVVTTATNITGSATAIVGDAPQVQSTTAPTPGLMRPENQIATPIYPSNTGEAPGDTLFSLQQAEVPASDLGDLTRRYKGIQNLPATIAPPPEWYQVGEVTQFWVSNVDENVNFKIEAKLQYVTEHSYFWVEEGVDFRLKDLQALAETFENQIYPTNRAFFGSEWTPGIDGDPHIYIVYARGLGASLAGCYSTVDEEHPSIHQYSNGHEMFLFNADTIGLSDSYTYGTLAHEFQHMIHSYQDRNEATWLAEGFSELATLLNDLYDRGFDGLFAKAPDIQLNTWPDDIDDSRPHYGASFLFVTYFLDRFGEQATQAVVRNQSNGMDSLDEVLASLGSVDPLRGRPLTADDVFLDWAITNYVQDEKIGDGRFNYLTYDNPPDFKATETINRCPTEEQTRLVNQYGSDYIRITCAGSHTLTWTGSTHTKVLPVDAHSGEYYLWSNSGDKSAMSLTRSFDFTGVNGPLTLSYWTWYTLEEDFDYVFLSISEDGENWQILTTPSGTPDDPSGNNFGWGYNGISGSSASVSWIEEHVDLSDYAGKVIHVRFEYVTDDAVNLDGMLLDDIAIPEIGYTADFEQDSGDWEMQGWVRMNNLLPQIYQLALIKLGDETMIEYIPLQSDNAIEIPFEIKHNEEIILVVTATTRFTRLPAAYSIEIR